MHLPLEESLFCKKHGANQTISPGDWFYEDETQSSPVLCVAVAKVEVQEDAVKVLSTDQLLDFAIKLAEEVWPDYWYIEQLSRNPKRSKVLSARVHTGKQGRMVVATADSRPAAIMSLIEEIVKQSEVKT